MFLFPFTSKNLNLKNDKISIICNFYTVENNLADNRDFPN